MFRNRVIRHLILPAVAPAVAFLALVAAIATAVKGITATRRGENETANWWIITTLILVFPLVLLAGPLG